MDQPVESHCSATLDIYIYTFIAFLLAALIAISALFDAEKYSTILPLLLPVGIGSLIALAKWPQLGIYFIATWNPLQYFFTRHLGVLPRATIWLDDGVVIILAFIAILRVYQHHGRITKTPIQIQLLIFLGITALSAAINQVMPFTLIAGLRSQFIYILFFYTIILLDLPETVLKRFFILSTLFALLQLPVNIIQFIRNGVGQFEPDAVFGTFAMGYANILGHYLLLFVFIYVGLIVENRKNIIPYLLISGCLLLAMILPGSRAALAFFMIGLLPILGKRILRIRILLAAAVLFACLVTAVLIYYQNRLGSYGVDLNPTLLLAEQLDNIHSPGRLYYLIYTWQLIQENIATFLFGFGPATYASTAGSALNAPILLEATKNAYSPFIQSQIVAVLGEYGVLGTITLFGIYGSILWMSIKIRRELISPFWRGIAAGMVAISIHFLLGSLVEKIWETQPIPYYYWFFAAAILLMHRREKYSWTQR